MAISTTTIGAWPKPDFVKLPDWFSAADPEAAAEVTRQSTAIWNRPAHAMQADADFAAMVAEGTRFAVRRQVELGIDIPTDGEIARENYLHYHCRHLGGIDFVNLATKPMRAGQFETAVPTWRGAVTTGENFLHRDYQLAQAATDRPVKITVPGPMTLTESTADRYYFDQKKLAFAIADALNFEILALAKAGCRHIQIDEPIFARFSEPALDWGIEALERAFHGCPDPVTRTLHICCGYPYGLDQPDYPKAPQQAYWQLAGAIDASSINAVSIEDAHRHNDLKLLEQFEATSVILGVVAIASSHVESSEQIRERLKAATEHIEPQRLIAAPDCGLGFLGERLATEKLANLCTAACTL